MAMGARFRQTGKGEHSRRMRPVKRGTPPKGKRTGARSHLSVQKRAKRPSARPLQYLGKTIKKATKR